MTMLRIRPEQMDVLNQHMLKIYIEKIIKHLRETFPDKTQEKTNEDLEGFINDGIKRASGYEITEEREVTLYIDLMMILGKNFEQQRSHLWILKFLKRQDLNQHEKMELIYTGLDQKSSS